MKPAHRIAILLAGICLLAQAEDDRRGPFTKPPRSVRSRDVDQQHVRLDLRFDWAKHRIDGQATHTMTLFRPLSELALDAADMQIKRVAVKAAEAGEYKNAKSSHRGGRLRITLDREYPIDTKLMVQIDYVISKPTNGAHFVLPDNSEPGQLAMVWTQSEPEYARYWYPCFDSPNDRLTSEIVARVPSEYFVLSNGDLIEKQMHGDGTQSWHWSQKKSHVPYLLSVVAGEFEAYEQEWNGIPITSYVPKGRLADAPRSFEKTADMMRFFSQRIGVIYPWSKYAQICVDEYNWGGMEHTSASTLNLGTLHDERAHLDTSSDGLVAHELAHQWFGDLMTCKDWGELWLNESFATYFATLWTEHDEGWEEATWKRYGEAQSYLGEDKRYRRPIVTYRYQRPSNMFDRHSYPKGGRVLHMLRFELGDTLFWRAIKRYTAVNQHRTVETADLRRAIEDATGQGMNWFFDQWLHHGGHPEFEVSWQWDATAKMARVTVKQTQKVDEMTPLFRTSAEIAVVVDGKSIVKRVQLSKAEESFHFETSQRPERVCFDPQDWILKTLKFEKSKEEWLDQLANDEYLICRVRAAQGLAELTKHEDVAAALIQAALSDRFWAVRAEAAKALGKFRGDKVRDGLIQVAKTDAKSKSRIEAIKALGQFKDKATASLLRQIIANDKSYYAVAAAIESLQKVDAANCTPDLIAALQQSSHREVVLKAAVGGLVKSKVTEAEETLTRMLETPRPSRERMVIISSLAKLQPDSNDAFERLTSELKNRRSRVRQSAISALGELATNEALEALRKHRSNESDPRTIEKIDNAIKAVEGKQSDTNKLRKELEALQKKNRDLQQRLKTLEEAAKKRQ